jgi:hypothetical protein
VNSLLPAPFLPTQSPTRSCVRNTDAGSSRRTRVEVSFLVSGFQLPAVMHHHADPASKLYLGQKTLHGGGQYLGGADFALKLHESLFLPLLLAIATSDSLLSPLGDQRFVISPDQSLAARFCESRKVVFPFRHCIRAHVACLLYTEAVICVWKSRALFWDNSGDLQASCARSLPHNLRSRPCPSRKSLTQML